MYRQQSFSVINDFLLHQVVFLDSTLDFSAVKGTCMKITFRDFEEGMKPINFFRETSCLAILTFKLLVDQIVALKNL